MTTTLNLRSVQKYCEDLGRGLPPVDAVVCIPRGGIPVGAMIAAAIPRPAGINSPPLLCLPDDVLSAAWPSPAGFVVVDDVYKTGKTLDRALHDYPNLKAAKAHAVLVDKGFVAHPDVRVLHYGMATQDWVTFPWETNETGGPEDAVRHLIEYLGDDPVRPGLVETPARVLRYLDEIRAQREQEFTATVFETQLDNLVVLSRVPFTSICEHHMLPYWGEADIAYVPGHQQRTTDDYPEPQNRLLGASKPARMLARAAAGLTVQETLTEEVAAQLRAATHTEDVYVSTMAIHSCMVLRGVKSHSTRMATASAHGKFRTDAALRAEVAAIVSRSLSL